MALKRPSFKCHFSLSVFSPQCRRYSAPGTGTIPESKRKHVPTSGIYPRGWEVGSMRVGVKPSATKSDLAIVASKTPATAAVVYTRNVFQAAPVVATKKIMELKEGKALHAVVANSGCANAVTGKGGLDDANEMSRKTDECVLGLHAGRAEEKRSTIVMSTGVIGQRLPIDKITDGIPQLVQKLGSSHEDWLGAATAICTTDTFPKLVSRTFTLPSHPDTKYSIAGMAKGSGMIHPDMGTLLGVICTDVAASTLALNTALREALPASFNSISVDGDTSTNDTVALLANGSATPFDVNPFRSPAEHKALKQPNHGDFSAFQAALTAVATDLAKLIVRDGEGATKFVTIRIVADRDTNAPTRRRIASSIARSPLVKTALYGKDANWGRILAAMGYALRDVPQFRVPRNGRVIPESTSVSFVREERGKIDELRLLVCGEPQQVNEARALRFLEHEDLEILIRLRDTSPGTEDQSSEATGSKSEKAGDEDDSDASDTLFYTCDLSHEYVTINGDYRT